MTKHEEIKKVIQDMTTDFNEKVSRYLDEIDMLNQQLLFDKTKIPMLNNRIHALYKKLHSKMSDEEKAKQISYEKKLSHINIGKIRPHENIYGEIVKKFDLNMQNYRLYRFILERRELHLNEVLERIGLTAKEYVKEKRVH